MKTDRVGAIHDLTCASEFIMVAIRSLTTPEAGGSSQEARLFVDLAVRKLAPLVGASVK